jgi:quercetin dioxygenase-like cupin family protein
MRGLTRAFGAALGILALSSPGLAAQDAVPVHREPRHRLVWEDGPVRVLDVQVPPGDTSLYHIHDAAILYVPIAVSPIDAQPRGGRWIGVGPLDTSRFRVGRVVTDTQYVVRPLTHRVANVGPGLFRLIAVVNGGPGDPAPADSTLPGQLETGSSWFGQSRLILAAGASTAWYTSPDPLVLVQAGGGAATVEREPEGGALEGAGAWAYVPPGARFRVRNGGAANTVILVQVR